MLVEALRDAGSTVVPDTQRGGGSLDAYEAFASGELWLRAMGCRWFCDRHDAPALNSARKSVTEAMAREGVRRPEAFLRIVSFYDFCGH